MEQSGWQWTTPTIVRVTNEVRRQLLAGRYGNVGDRFVVLRQLAKDMQVSLATAQKAVQNLKAEGVLITDSTRPPRIGPELERVRAAQPHQRIGIVVTNLSSFFSRLVQKVQKAAARRGMQVLVASSGYRLEQERRAIQEFLDIGVEAILLCPGVDPDCPPFYNQLKKELAERGVRLCFFGRQVPGVEVDAVLSHHASGASDVARHLAGRGSVFAFIQMSRGPKPDLRLAGYRAALYESGIELGEDYIAEGNGWDAAAGYRAMAKLMEKDVPPDAVFAFQDLLAIGALSYCLDHHIAVPKDVAIVGYDDSPESRVVRPPLTTVRHPVDSMVDMALNLVCDNSDDRLGKAPYVVLLNPELIVRQSTDLDSDNAGDDHTTVVREDLLV